MAALKYKTFAIGTVGSPYTAGDGTLVLSAGHGSRFPTTGDFWIRIANANHTIRKVTAHVDDTLTLAAGAQDGSIDLDAAQGTNVYWVMGEAALDQLRADLCQTGADADKAAAKAGSLYLPNDGLYLRRDTGAAFASWGPIFPMVEPVLADFAWVNQGGATAVTTQGGICLTASAGASANLRILKRAAPVSAYTIEAAFLPRAVGANYKRVGIGFRHSSSGKLALWYFVYNSAWQLNHNTFDDAQLAGGASQFNVVLPCHGLTWLAIGDDLSTTRSYKFSADGKNWETLYTCNRTDSFTADEVLFVAGTDFDPTYQAAMTLVHWKQIA